MLGCVVEVKIFIRDIDPKVVLTTSSKEPSLMVKEKEED